MEHRKIKLILLLISLVLITQDLLRGQTLNNVISYIIAGILVPIAGLYTQSTLKNDIADPFILGISSGASIGIIISYLFFNSVAYLVFGFIGASIVSLIIIIASLKIPTDRIILLGLSCNMLIGSLIGLLVGAVPEKAHKVVSLASANLTTHSNSTLIILTMLTIILYLISIKQSRWLTYLKLDNNIKFPFSDSIKTTKIKLLCLASTMSCVSVMSIGIIGFMGVLVPQAVRRIKDIKPEDTIQICALAGICINTAASLLLSIPIISKCPISMTISTIAAPLFIITLLTGATNDNQTKTI